MKIGYPCINRSLGCSSSRTFRLASYSKERMRSSIEENLECLDRILRYNVEKEFLFFRLSSDIIPFASHPVMDLNWREEYKTRFQKIGRYIKKNKMRISMHPDQFIVLNSDKEDVVERSKKELEYHADLFIALGLSGKQKFQLHVGGVYGDKESALARFCEVYLSLPEKVRKHLVIENDDRSFSLEDCLKIHRRTQVPVLLDAFHHLCLNNKETLGQAVQEAAGTWTRKDGLPMLDFSLQKPGGIKGAHAESIDKAGFRRFLKELGGVDCDIMLEIKNKEKSAEIAIDVIRTLREETSPGIFGINGI